MLKSDHAVHQAVIDDVLTDHVYPGALWALLLQLFCHVRPSPVVSFDETGKDAHSLP